MALLPIEHVYTFQPVLPDLSMSPFTAAFYGFSDDNHMYVLFKGTDGYTRPMAWNVVDFSQDPPALNGVTRAPFPGPGNLNYNWPNWDITNALRTVDRFTDEVYTVFMTNWGDGQGSVIDVASEADIWRGTVRNGGWGFSPERMAGVWFPGATGGNSDFNASTYWMVVGIDNADVSSGNSGSMRLYLMERRFALDSGNDRPWQDTSVLSLHMYEPSFRNTVPGGLIPMSPTRALHLWQDLSGMVKGTFIDVDFSTPTLIAGDTYDLVQQPGGNGALVAAFYCGDTLYLFRQNAPETNYSHGRGPYRDNAEQVFTKYDMSKIAQTPDPLKSTLTMDQGSIPVGDSGVVEVTVSIYMLDGNPIPDNTAIKVEIQTANNPPTNQDGALTLAAGDTAFDSNDIPLATSLTVDSLNGAVTVYYHPPRNGSSRPEVIIAQAPGAA